jgi:hypothetical protein
MKPSERAKACAGTRVGVPKRWPGASKGGAAGAGRHHAVLLLLFARGQVRLGRSVRSAGTGRGLLLAGHVAAGATT